MEKSLKIGIVGNGEDKFTELGAERAKMEIFRIIVYNPDAKIVSGHSRMRGIDIWTEHEIPRGISKTRVLIVRPIHPLSHAIDLAT